MATLHTDTFTNSLGELFRTWVYEPTSPAPGNPCVLVAPTLLSGPQVSLSLIAALNAVGWWVAAVHFPGALQVCTISNASPGVVTLTGHNLSANTAIIFQTGGALPSPLAAGTVYYVKTVLDANTFTVSASSGGAAINTTTAGSGSHAVQQDESFGYRSGIYGGNTVNMYAEFHDWLQSTYSIADYLHGFEQSRGALEIAPFAADEPDRMPLIAALYPDNDHYIYPSATGVLWNAYNVANQAAWEAAYQASRVPILRASDIHNSGNGPDIRIWHGDSDPVVPLATSTTPFLDECRGDLVTIKSFTHESAYWNYDIVRYLTNQPVAFGKTYVELGLSANWAATGGAVNIIPFDIVRSDENGNISDADHDWGTPSPIFTAWRNQRVRVTIQLSLVTPTVDTIFWPGVYVNGTPIAAGTDSYKAVQNGEAAISVPIQLKAGDVMTFRFYAGAGVTVQNAGFATFCRVEAED